MKIKVQAYLTGREEIAAWQALRTEYGSDLDVIRELLARHAPPSQDYTGAIIGWSEPRTASAAAECVYCELGIQPGQQYQAADTVGDVGGVFAHVACVESD